MQQNSLKAFIAAARLNTLPAAVAPVLAAATMAWCDLNVNVLNFPLIPFSLSLFFALFMQVAANFVNDWYDCKKGADTEQRLGPKRACAQGWVTLGAMKRAVFITMIIASITGLPLVYYGGTEMLWVGIGCLLFAILYTVSFSYLGLGDLLVLIFFGLVPFGVTYYILTGKYDSLVFLISLSMGFVVDGLLIVNNYRDYAQDKKSGKKTIIVRLGEKSGLCFYLFSGIIAILLAIPLIAAGKTIAFLFLLPYLFFHFTTYRRMKTIGRGQELNEVLGLTARNIVIYSLLLSMGLVVSTVYFTT